MILAMPTTLAATGTLKLTPVTASDATPGDQRFYRLERKPAP